MSRYRRARDAVLRQEEDGDVIEVVVVEGVDAKDKLVKAIVDKVPHQVCQARDTSGAKARSSVANIGHA